MKFPQHAEMPSSRSAFTMIEVMVASALIGITFLAFMAGFSVSFQGIQLDRENSRAAQILLETGKPGLGPLPGIKGPIKLVSPERLVAVAENQPRVPN